MPKHSDKHRQNRHILSMMGVACWVQKHCPAQPLPPMPDRLCATKKNHQSSIQPPKTDQPQQTDIKHQPDTKPALAVVPAKLPVQTAQTAPKTPIKPATPKINIQYQVQGVRFGRWILVVDKAMMNDKAHHLWSSLTQALQHYAQQTQILCKIHQGHYPLDKTLSATSLGLANRAFEGFVLYLLMGGQKNTQVVFLTAMTEGICYPKAHQNLPSIDDMVANPTLKKQLWATLLAN